MVSKHLKLYGLYAELYGSYFGSVQFVHNQGIILVLGHQFQFSVLSHNSTIYEVLQFKIFFNRQLRGGIGQLTIKF